MQPLGLGPEPLLNWHDAIFELNLIGYRRGADRANRPRRESRRALLDYKAGDSLAAGLGVGAGEDDAPLGLVRMRDENLGGVEDVGIALANRFALDRAGRIGTARRFRDREEGVPGILDRAAGVGALLFFAARVDHRWRGAPEDPASGVVEAHAMLRHFLGQHAHVESAQAAAAVLARRAHAPHLADPFKIVRAPGSLDFGIDLADARDGARDFRDGGFATYAAIGAGVCNRA